jgi:hypothetical protein
MKYYSKTKAVCSKLILGLKQKKLLCIKHEPAPDSLISKYLEAEKYIPLDPQQLQQLFLSVYPG